MEHFPDDPGIPALAAFAQCGVRQVLATAGVDGVFDGAQVVRHVSGSRLTMRVESDSGPLAVKAYRNSPQKIIAALNALESAGFAAEKGPSASRLVGCDRTLRFIVTSWFQAPNAKELVFANRGVRAGELAAHWLRATHECAIETGVAYAPADVIRHAHTRAAKVSLLQPELAPLLDEWVARLGSWLPDPGRSSLRHGSFSLRHIFDLGDGPGLIDWDSIKYGPAEIDAGTFLGKLSRGARKHPRLAAEAELAAESFGRGVGTIVDQKTLHWYEAASLLNCLKYRSMLPMDGFRAKTEVLFELSMAALKKCL